MQDLRWGDLQNIDYQEKNEIQENEKFKRPLDRTLVLSYSSDTMIENIIEWKTKDKMWK
jgi:hypothetical protein